MGANQTALENTEALLAFFDDFPEYKSNDFYISGESYGGIYVPTLSQKVFQSGKFPQFKGFMVGNGAWGGDCAGDDASLSRVPPRPRRRERPPVQLRQEGLRRLADRLGVLPAAGRG